MPSNFDYSQVGFVVSKKVSKKAVVRNSLRRRAGAIVEASYPKLKTPTKMIILIRRDFSALTPSELNKEITTLLGRQVLWKNYWLGQLSYTKARYRQTTGHARVTILMGFVGTTRLAVSTQN